MKHKVVLLRSNSFQPEPPVGKMAEALLELGFEVMVVSWDRSCDSDNRREKLLLLNGTEIDIVYLCVKSEYGAGLKKNLKPLFDFQKKLKRWLIDNKNNYDIIHAFDFDTGFTAKRIAKKYNKKFIYHILDFYIDCHRSIGGFLRSLVKSAEYSVISSADVTVVCTENRVNQIDGSKPKRLYVIHNTPNLDLSVKSELDIGKSERMRIVYVGGLNEGRMLGELLQVVADDASLELHIGGYGTLIDDVTRYSKEYDNIFFYGKLLYNDTLNLEKQCDIMTAIYDPSIRNHKFAAPNKFYEALALDKPVIMVKNTGWDDVILNNSLGVLIDYTEDGLKDGINRLKQMNLSSFDLSLKNMYSWEEMKKRIAEIYSL